MGASFGSFSFLLRPNYIRVLRLALTTMIDKRGFSSLPFFFLPGPIQPPTSFLPRLPLNIKHG